LLSAIFLLIPIASLSAQAPVSELRPLPNQGMLVEQASHLIAIGDYPQAEATVRIFVVANPALADAQYLLAYILLRENKPAQSLAEYTNAAKLRTPTSEDLKNVALDYVLLEAYEDAERWIARSIQMAPNDADAWYVSGRIGYGQKHYADAAKCFEKALTIAPHNVKAENNLGLAYEGLDRTEDAIGAYRRAIEWQQGINRPTEQPLLNLAIILMKKGDLSEALALLKQAEEIAPKDPKIHEELGQIYLEQDHSDMATKEFEAALKLTPNSGALHFLLGRAYRRQGLGELANAEFAIAASLLGTRSSPNQP
jgi:Flp pilus assembly protein TadD